MGAAPPPTPSSVRARRTFLAVGLAVAVALAGSLAYVALSGPGRGAAGRGPTEIDILPSAGSRSACLVGTPGAPRPTLGLANGTLQGNTYDVPGGTVGHVGMCYNASTGALFAYANWSQVGGSGGWFSYPQIAYGVNDYDGAATTYTNQSPAWELPQTVATTVGEDLWVTATYAIRPPSPTDVDGYDLSFDDFLSEGLPPTLEVPPFVEVEIFLAHNISYPAEWVHWSMPTLVNSTVSNEPWDVAYWCHGTDNRSNGNVSFDFSYGGQAGNGLREGTLGVNLSAVLAEVETLMPGASCWQGPTNGFSGFYLGEEDLGSEDGALGGASFDYNWTVSAYCLHTLVGPPTVAGLDCRGPAPDSARTRSAGPSTGPAGPRAALLVGSGSAGPLLGRAADGGRGRDRP